MQKVVGRALRAEVQREVMARFSPSAAHVKDVTRPPGSVIYRLTDLRRGRLFVLIQPAPNVDSFTVEVAVSPSSDTYPWHGEQMWSSDLEPSQLPPTVRFRIGVAVGQSDLWWNLQTEAMRSHFPVEEDFNVIDYILRPSNPEAAVRRVPAAIADAMNLVQQVIAQLE